jgi:hypothetical protein
VATGFPQVCAQGTYGIAASSGVLIDNMPISISGVTDGTSTTMVIGEMSDWCRDSSGNLVDLRPTSIYGAFMGADSYLYCGAPNSGTKPTGSYFGTAVRYPIGHKDGNLVSQDGKAIEYGGNKPIQSAHANGAFVLMCDGSVKFMANTTDLNAVVLRLCTRSARDAVVAEY